MARTDRGFPFNFFLIGSGQNVNSVFFCLKSLLLLINKKIVKYNKKIHYEFSKALKKVETWRGFFFTKN